MRPESAAFRRDVRHVADPIGTFIAGLTKDDYLVDESRRSAMESQLEIIGEALNNLRRVDGDTTALIPQVERIIGLRDVLAHGYAVVDGCGLLRQPRTRGDSAANTVGLRMNVRVSQATTWTPGDRSPKPTDQRNDREKASKSVPEIGSGNSSNPTVTAIFLPDQRLFLRR